jgi:putative transposase
MAGRVAEIMAKGKATRRLEREWKNVRRGWCLGGAEFREEMLERLGRVMKGRKRESYSGTEVCRHDEQEGKILIEKGLKALGCTMEAMRALSPSDVRKQGLIWLLRTQTTCGVEWINRRLAVGHASNISRAMKAMDEAPTPAAAAIKCKLLKCKD